MISMDSFPYPLIIKNLGDSFMYNIVPIITIHGNIELVIIINYQFPYVISLDMKMYAEIHPNTLPRDIEKFSRI